MENGERGEPLLYLSFTLYFLHIKYVSESTRKFYLCSAEKSSLFLCDKFQLNVKKKKKNLCIVKIILREV